MRVKVNPVSLQGKVPRASGGKKKGYGEIRACQGARDFLELQKARNEGRGGEHRAQSRKGGGDLLFTVGGGRKGREKIVNEPKHGKASPTKKVRGRSISLER